MTEPRDTAARPTTDADWERMAVQIDGRLDDGAAYLDGLSDEDLAVFAEAAAITRELEDEDAAAAGSPPRADEAEGVPGVIPLHRPARRPVWRDPRWAMAAAAVIAAVVLVPLATRGGGAVRGPSQAVAMLEQPAAGLPATYDEREWGTRGPGEGGPDAARAARLGMFGVDLELAVRARDAAATRLMADKIAFELGGVIGGSTVAGQFSTIGKRAGASPDELLSKVEEANRLAAGFVDADHYALGAWAEAARFAVVRRDAAFFREARFRRTLSKADEVLADDERARTALTAIRASLDVDPPDWTALGPAAADLLRILGF